MTFDEMRLRHPFTSFLLILGFVAGAMAQGYVEILPDEVKNPFFERQKSIINELSTVQASEWAGTYSRDVGHTWSEVLAWDPRNGFAAFRDTCSNGPRAWVNYGGASFRDGVILFSPERNKEDAFVLELPAKEFTPVRWGEEHWLVPSDKLALFAYAVNSRSGDPYKIAYLKSDDMEKSRTGRPELPAPYKRLLGLPSIKTRVVGITARTDDWYPPMTIDAGKDKGVIEGMSFWLVGHRGITVTITVTEVRDRASVVEVTEWGKHGSGLEKEIVPALGWRFTSRMPSPGY